MQKLTRLTLISSIGSALEYYNFVTYAMLAAYLSLLFFPKDNPVNAMLEIMTLFSVAYLASPFGAVLAVWADRKGRKTIFLISIVMMALATIAMGLLPTSHQIGLLGTLAIILLRLVQGVAQGAELPGGITFITEHAEDSSRGFLCGLVFMGVGFGAVLSTLVNTGLTTVLTNAQIMQWGWRLPFILGGVLGLFGFFIRRKVEETPVFLKQRPINYQIQWQAVKDHRFQFLRGFGIILLPASMVTFGLFLPAFIEENFHYTEKQAFSALLLSFTVSSFLLPLIGYCSDKIGRKLLLSLGMILTLLCLYPLFNLLNLGQDWALVLFMLGYHLLIVLMAGCYPCLLTELFATPIRYTGVTLCYMGCYSFAGLVPFIIMSLYKYTLRPEFAVMSVLFICGLISISALARAPVLKELSDEVS